jgi:hypothetical protein
MKHGREILAGLETAGQGDLGDIQFRPAAEHFRRGLDAATGQKIIG